MLTRGQRPGYIALSSAMPDRERIRPAVFAAQSATYFALPTALLQHALPDIETLSFDVEQLQRRRDCLVDVWQSQEYDLHVPVGTYYLLMRSPWEDDRAFLELLTECKIFCLPGSLVELPGDFRISLMANEDIIERAAGKPAGSV